MSVPAAPIFPAGVWPIVTGHRSRFRVDTKHGRRFGASRSNGRRHHIGVDLWANDGDHVVAIADGVVVRNRGVYRSGTRDDGTKWKVRRVLLRHVTDAGLVVIVGYGEVWPLNGFREGRCVRAGEPFARIAMQDESTMLHFETWSEPPLPGDDGQWQQNEETPPRGLLDPTALLLDLAQRHRR